MAYCLHLEVRNTTQALTGAKHEKIITSNNLGGKRNDS